MAKGAFEDPTSEGSSDRTIFKLDDEQTAAFLEALANPPTPTQALRDLMARPAPWNVDKT
jgi:uncharacterized protein (DUF1778 family)